MISVVIPARASGNLLIPTLAALVPGAATGVVREVLIVDGPEGGDAAEIADAAGCDYLSGPADTGSRLALGASRARGPWLMFLEPEGLLQEGWTREVRSFIETLERTGTATRHAACFRVALDGFGAGIRLREQAAALRQMLGGRPQPAQGLLIHADLYRALGGHRPGPDAAERFARRLPRGRILVLRSHILLPPG